MDCAFDEVGFDAVAFDVCIPEPPDLTASMLAARQRIMDMLREDEELLIL